MPMHGRATIGRKLCNSNPRRIRLIFDYPAPQEKRRHGPSGYRNYESYRPWLRDEFDFRCVYCLS